MMRKQLRRRIVLGLSGLAATSLAAPDAHACGGFFCNAAQPVIQTGEAIIFTVDLETRTVEATINIAYQGQASDFAWILPLQSAPTAIELGSTLAFQVMQQLTSPRFQLSSVENLGICEVPGQFAYDGVTSECVGGGCGEPAGSGHVDILQQSEVGPYDTVVLSGKTAEDIRQWLVDDGYNVSDAMMQQVVPYVAQGDALMALQLQKDQSVGDIQPIKVVMSGDRACVPLRLTAIAAQDDMQVLVGILSNHGRAIPENYFHVTPNLARIDWRGGGANYSPLIAEAVDEGQGNAFTTEFAGPSAIFAQQIYVPGRIDVAALAAASRIDEFLRLVVQMGLTNRSELLGILTRAISDEVLAAVPISRTAINRCVRCVVGVFGEATMDSATAAQEIQERILDPEQKAQASFDKFRYFTRLNTFISPAEMGIDPDFSFSSTLPDVSNAHSAKMIRDCGAGGPPGSAVTHLILEDGTQIDFEGDGTTFLDAMPAAAKVEQLAQGLVIRDNTAAIKAMLDEQNARTAGGCGCRAGTARRRILSSAALVGGLALALGLRRRRYSARR
ncbi:MAG: DUF2330 domain-containing protein [Deltaproteobacteria bacterium]|nr:DUF2330 domain-containing protein [Deltaproteobacteria bacterium]